MTYTLGQSSIFRRCSWSGSCVRFGNYTESGQGLLMCTHCLNTLSDFHKDTLNHHCFLHTDPQHCLHTLQPRSGSVFSMHPLLQARSSYHIASWRVLRPELPRNGFCSGHAMLIVILHTLRQHFPCQLLLSKCWGPCDIRRKPPPTDTSFHKRHTQGKLPESVMS